MILLTDTDGDGLPDREEMEWLTNPSDSDSDDDGVSDGSEAGAVAEGFHPAVFDEPMTPEEWASEFAKGVAIGDAGEGTTVPYLLGSIASSGVSTIPVIGWIVGVVPYAGDPLDIASKVARLSRPEREPRRRRHRGHRQARGHSGRRRADVLRRVSTSISQLQDAGVSDAAVLRPAVSRQGVEHVTDAMRRVASSTGARLDFASGWRAAENAVAATLDDVVAAQRYTRVPGHSYGRYLDIVDADGTEIRSILWYFVASGRSGSLGADPRVLDLLEENGIPYAIHLP